MKALYTKSRIRHIAAAALISAVVAACGSHHSHDFEEVDKSLSRAETTDSVDVKISEEKKDTVPPITAATARQFMAQSDYHRRYETGILPRMLDEVPEYAVRLLNSPYNYFIVVDKSSMNVLLFDKYGNEVGAYKMACAKNYGTKHVRRDSRTPEGFFTIAGIFDSTDWLFTDDDGNTSDVKGQFGPRFIRLKTPVSTQIGIHGTCAPWSLGGRRSHGCIRLANENILKLVEYAEKGMPVIVSPGPRDVKVNESEGYHIPVIHTGHNDNPKTDSPAPSVSSSDTTKNENLPVSSEKTGTPDSDSLTDSSEHLVKE